MPVNYATPAPEALFPVAGVRLGTAEAGIRKKARKQGRAEARAAEAVPTSDSE